MPSGVISSTMAVPGLPLCKPCLLYVYISHAERASKVKLEPTYVSGELPENGVHYTPCSAKADGCDRDCSCRFFFSPAAAMTSATMWVCQIFSYDEDAPIRWPQTSTSAENNVHF